nr:MAG: DNA pilot protein [Microvirus sp.]
MSWLESLGTMSTGLFNAYNARKAASKQMNFQAAMSNTAYQRAAADLEAAGLNRTLAFGTPASTPGGAGFNVNMPDIGQSIAAGSQAASARSQADSAKVNARTGELNNEVLQAELDRKKELLPFEKLVMEAQASLSRQQAVTSAQDAALKAEEVKKARVTKGVYELAEPVLKALSPEAADARSMAIGDFFDTHVAEPIRRFMNKPPVQQRPRSKFPYPKGAKK